MKLVTKYAPPGYPAPNIYDWTAYFEEDDEHGTTGHGATEVEALKDLVSLLCVQLDRAYSRDE